jgi:hypothetical protein
VKYETFNIFQHKLSWISNSMTIVHSIRDYRNSVFGLIGNFNSRSMDDIHVNTFRVNQTNGNLFGFSLKKNREIRQVHLSSIEEIHRNILPISSI